MAKEEQKLKLDRPRNEEIGKLQQQYLKLQLIDQQIKQIQENLIQLDKQLAELKYIAQSLDELRDVKENSEILVPISPGIFTKAELKSNNELVVNIGGGITAEKNIEETKKMLSDQMSEATTLGRELEVQLKNLVEEALQTEALINLKNTTKQNV